ncbi:rod-determining factor RdfA [Halomontanus rarus]|uniref:rod-determining factor RdfA n=1 Tax=Halomontanus rarus TaxID=3034020 RepID=UPI0023E87ECD|nr:rod-determining factor RdfA [Halovivax sp. TS33]
MADTTSRTQGEGSLEESNCSCKIGRVLRAYSLEGFNTELETRWTADGEEHLSLRELETHLNKNIFREELNSKNISFLDKELEIWYSILTGEDPDNTTQIPIKRRLERQGVDVDQVVNDFVSYQTINRHLKKCLEVEQKARDETDVQYIRRRVQQIYALENKLQTIIYDSLTQLDETGRISLNDFDVILDSNVICSNCGAHHTISDIVVNQGCKCDSQNE